MKKTRLFIAMLAAVAALASCEDKPVNPDGPDKPDEPQKEEPKSEECRLTAFVVTVGTEALEGFVDQTDKSIEISYLPDHIAGLKAATAVATISDKATITPDPTQPIDYTVEGGVEFTVTAEDGEHTTVYTVYTAAAEFSETTVKVWEKTFGELGLAGKPNFDCGIAFAARDRFAYADLRVFDLEGNYVGSLNTEGLPELAVYGDGAIKATGQLGALTNDVNGVLVAIATHEGTYADGSTVGCRSEVYAWKDGWDKAPTKIYGPVDYQCMYMSVAGDVNGDFILNFRTGAGNPQMHHVLVYKGGKYFDAEGKPACTWYGPFIQHPGTDGCWGQMLSFFSGDPEEGFVCWDSLAAAEYGESGNASAAFYVYNEGLTAFQNGAATELPLYGQVTWSIWNSEGQHFSYGNYSIGHVRAFKYNGVKYIIAASSSWPCNWITVQKAEDVAVDDEETEDVNEAEANYLLPTDMIEGAASCAPCSAYVYDPATLTGHIVYAAQSAKVVAYDIVTKIL